MNMQQMMAQAQKMQRELKKAMAALAEKEFVISKGGAVTVTVLGSKEVKAIEKIDEEAEEINERITGQPGGFGF